MEDIPLIEVPVSRALVLSTTYITQMDDLGVLDRLVGLDAFAYTSNPAVLAMIEEGKLVEIAPTGIEANVEVALDAEPDLIMAFSAGIPEYDLYPPLQDAGLPVVISADWIESAPLARAEWVKFMSLFFNAEAEANRVFETIATEYEAAAALVAGVSDKPLVMSDVPYEGTWYLSGGQSYTARLFRDAGGQYVWAGDPSEGTLALDIETVFDQAIDAEVWVNVFGYEGLADLAALDERVTGFAAFQNGQVYANDARGTAFGTELFETGVAHPHVVLLDLIRIFHPDLLPDHALYYYRQLQ
jgi:iron complex transport system substrate-binding protein